MNLFFSGIGGSGVSAIAGFMAERGHRVSGSDRLFDADPQNKVCLALRAKGIEIFPQDGSGIDRLRDLAVFSTAVEKANPDFVMVHQLGIPAKTRPEFLVDITSAFRTFAVAGTSGKSTVSGMLAFLMRELGMEPNFLGGGRVKQFRAEGNPGNYLSGSSDLLVFEACESDGTLVNYRPHASLIMNLDLDHHSVEETASLFRNLRDNTSGIVITGADDKNLSRFSIIGDAAFSIQNESEYRAVDVRYSPLGSSFKVREAGFELRLPGAYNVYNALACIAVLSELGISLADVSEALRGFRGIERRFDIHLDEGRCLVVDDYAHNPHKIESLMKAMRDVRDSVCYIFQPHGFGPTRIMKDGYIEVFSGNLRDSDHLILLPVYYAGGTAARDISSYDLAKGVGDRGKSVEVLERAEVFGLLGKWQSYAVLGARDDSLSGFARDIAARLLNCR